MGLETIQFARTKNAKTHNKPFTKTQATNNASSTLVQSQNKHVGEQRCKAQNSLEQIIICKFIIEAFCFVGTEKQSNATSPLSREWPGENGIFKLVIYRV